MLDTINTILCAQQSVKSLINTTEALYNVFLSPCFIIAYKFLTVSKIKNMAFDLQQMDQATFLAMLTTLSLHEKQGFKLHCCIKLSQCIQDVKPLFKHAELSRFFRQPMFADLSHDQ